VRGGGMQDQLDGVRGAGDRVASVPQFCFSQSLLYNKVIGTVIGA
jgi:hypothetical protein